MSKPEITANCLDFGVAPQRTFSGIAEYLSAFNHPKVNVTLLVGSKVLESFTKWDTDGGKCGLVTLETCGFASHCRLDYRAFTWILHQLGYKYCSPADAPYLASYPLDNKILESQLPPDPIYVFSPPNDNRLVVINFALSVLPPYEPFSSVASLSIYANTFTARTPVIVRL